MTIEHKTTPETHEPEDIRLLIEAAVTKLILSADSLTERDKTLISRHRDHVVTLVQQIITTTGIDATSLRNLSVVKPPDDKKTAEQPKPHPQPQPMPAPKKPEIMKRKGKLQEWEKIDIKIREMDKNAKNRADERQRDRDSEQEEYYELVRARNRARKKISGPRGGS